MSRQARQPTDKIIARTLLFSKNQNLWLAKTPAKKYWLYLRQVACWKKTNFILTKTIIETKKFYRLTKTLAEKRGLLLLPEFCQEKPSRFWKPTQLAKNKAKAAKQSLSKPLQTKTPAKNLEPDFSDFTKPTWTYANVENIAKRKSRELENLLAEKILTKYFTLKSATAKKDLNLWAKHKTNFANQRRIWFCSLALPPNGLRYLRVGGVR